MHVVLEVSVRIKLWNNSSAIPWEKAGSGNNVRQHIPCRIVRPPNAPEFISGDPYHPSRTDGQNPRREAGGMPNANRSRSGRLHFSWAVALVEKSSNGVGKQI